MKAFKIVRRYYDKRLSPYAVVTVEYKPGEYVPAPEGTGLLCFRKMEQAVWWIGWDAHTGQKIDPDLEVWEVTGKGKIPLPAEALLYREDITPEELKRFWAGEQTSEDTMKWPAGTVAFKQVMLRRKIL